MAKDDEKAKDDGLDIIVEDAKKDPRMKKMAGDESEAEEETGAGDEDESTDSVDDCLNEAFDKRNDREGFVSAMKKAISGY
jgi:hypothetical protein